FACPWWYRKEFELPVNNKLSYARLGFEGINYRANIWLNGRQIGTIEEIFGSFRVFKLNIAEFVKPGKNILAVEVFPPRLGDFTMGFVDWNPQPPDQNMGIWRPVTLYLSGPVSIENPFVTSEIDLNTLDKASLTVSAELVNYSDNPVEGMLVGTMEEILFSQKIQLNPGERKIISFLPEHYRELQLKNPRLWWPHDLGEPNLYGLKLNFISQDIISDEKEITFGIRQVEDYVDDEGHRGFKINGRKVLIRGGGWVDDIFLADDHRTLKAKVEYTKHMNLNAIRLEGFWGSGRQLYSLCDEQGILLMAGWSCQWEWDEYMGKSCGQYGGVQTPEEMELVARSFRDQVVWLRNHPSIFVWLAGSDKLPKPELERKYVKILEEYDQTRPYLAAAARLISEVSGSTGVKMHGPYDYVPPIYWFEDESYGGAYGFNTETGPGPQPPPLESLKKMLPEERLWPVNDYWEYHCARKQFSNIDRYLEALTNRYGEAEDILDFDRKAQVMNYEAVRAMFEAFAAHKHRSKGVIQWMLNAAWPKLYWQLYDYYLMPNGAFYGAKKASQPVNILYHYGNNEIFAINFGLTPRNSLKATVRIFDFQGKERYSRVKDIEIKGLTSSRVMQVPDLPDLSPVYFIDLKLEDAAGDVISDNFYWLSTKKDVMDYPATKWYVTPIKEYADFTALNDLPKAKIKVEHDFKSIGTQEKIIVTLENTSGTLAFFIYLRVVGEKNGKSVLPIYWDDNYISILPGERKTVSGVYNSEDLQGETPVLRVSGWNLEDFELPIIIR
ncbi:MAG: glycosyl hydrolase 2 galactose-binding domain-containing protein, partial [Acidobacteriota bacterium]